MNYVTQIAKFDIISKEGLRVPFVVNDFQKKYLETMTNRDIILKARQIGYSSLLLAIFSLDFLLKENSRSVVISHDGPAAQKLLDRTKFFITSAQDKGLLVNLKYNSRNEIVNSEMNSSIYIGAAGSKSFGRGDTINNLLLSEFAFYDNQELLLASVLQALVPTGRCTIETTSNGLDFFKTFYDRSKRGETGFKCHFADSSFYSTEFLETKKAELGERLFKQEYATDDVSCFLYSGDPYFDMESLKELLDKSSEPIKQGNLIGLNNPVFEDTDTGYWKFWDVPKEEYQYILSADVAETRDFAAACIIDRFSFKVVATFHGHLEASLYGEELARAGRYFNSALIVIEKNNQGLAVLQRLRDLYYPNLYQRQIVDSVTNNETTDIGWITSSKTRPLMLANLQAVIKQKTLNIQDIDMIKELMSFARNEKGRPEAIQGSFDDRVICLAIGVTVYQTTEPANNDMSKIPDDSSRVGRM